MKRFLLFLLVVGLFVGQASAANWILDHGTATQFTTHNILPGVGDSDTLMNFSVHQYNDAGYGVPWLGGSVGFRGDLADGTSGDLTAAAEISTPGVPTGLPAGSYDGITAFFTNDNDDTWGVELFYQIGATEYNSSGFTSITPTLTQTVIAPPPSGPGSLNLGSITKIGFRIQGSWPSQSGSDTFHVSVPVPGAILLGVLGLGVAGIKLRKFA